MENNINISSPLTPDGAQRSVYFIGIGGIGMSALARYFLSKGFKVSGFDKTKTALTGTLQKEGIAVHFAEDVSAIPTGEVLVVYTPAIPASHAELEYCKTHGYTVVKRSDVLQAISAHSFNVCVAGTHGKTTISSMTAHLLTHSGYGCNAFLGGIAINYNTNFWSSDNNVCVIEADEYDRSFLKLQPDIAIITSMDADHLDIYGTEASMQDAFIEFGNKTKPGGLLITKHSLLRAKEIDVQHRLTYSLQNDAADVFASNIQMKNGGYRFDVRLPNVTINDLELHIGGMHNVENAVVAITVANELEIDVEKIKAALAAFKGVKRRFEYVIPPQNATAGAYVQPVLIDDYAHHPEELKVLLQSVRSLFPERILTVVFQPHLFTRTRDLAAEFSSALSLADTVILLPIYPAREQPIAGVDSSMLLSNVKDAQEYVMSKDEMLAWMKDHSTHLDKEFGEVIVMAGAGDIDTLVQPVKNILENR